MICKSLFLFNILFYAVNQFLLSWG